MTKQPEWECIANLGDANPIDHGGKFVLVDKTGQYPPEMEVLEPLEPCGVEIWQVWRFVMDRCTYADGVLSDNKFHPDKPAWFADDIGSVAETFGVDRDELVKQLCSDDARELAEGYYCLFGYYSPDNFDSYPMDLNRKEAAERYSGEPYNLEVNT